MSREAPAPFCERLGVRLPRATHFICHCKSETQARGLKDALEQRLMQCCLELQPNKTKIVYCKDANRQGSYPERRFDFLGYTFRPRASKNRAGNLFMSFAPAVSDKAAKAMRQRIRRWRLHHRSDLALAEIARWAEPVLRGWARYYGRFHPSRLREVLRTLDYFLIRWAQRKYKRLRRHYLRVWEWLHRLKAKQPTLFAHWYPQLAVGR